MPSGNHRYVVVNPADGSRAEAPVRIPGEGDWKGPVELRRRHIRGWLIDVRGHHRLTIDPVCRMAVDPESAPGRLVIDDTVYFFCSLACAGEFAREPKRFVD